MDVVAKLPQMEDKALGVLEENAKRLEQAGTPAQKIAAADLIPAIQAEVSARREAKLAKAREARQAAPKRAAKPRATARKAEAVEP
jgi:hypothetical protein